MEDKNEKDIYEGDIVMMIYNQEEPHMYGHEHIGIIKYTPTMFYVETRTFSKLDENKWWSPLLNGWTNGRIKTIEVIGNIYQNPELLKGVD